MKKSPRTKPTLAVCIPVWNRGELFRISFVSLLRQLRGVDATIWIFDNGSASPTRRIVESVQSAQQRLHKVFLPENMGQPYVVNVFAQAIQEECDYVGYRSPQYVMLMDADAYFQKPVVDLIRLYAEYYQIGVLSGYDAPEHAVVNEKAVALGKRTIVLKEKRNERMITLLLKKEEFLRCYPFPHYRNRDIDWEIMQWNPNSMMKRKRKIFAVSGYVLHLGLAASTWKPGRALPTTPEEQRAVRTILRRNNVALKKR